LESGIPIDRIGGVSIGAFMGALWCQERDIGQVHFSSWFIIINKFFLYAVMVFTIFCCLVVEKIKLKVLACSFEIT
jgi:hypothetical protein